eukprot:908165-Pyramimonas_sp.AAC.2
MEAFTSGKVFHFSLQAEELEGVRKQHQELALAEKWATAWIDHTHREHSCHLCRRGFAGAEEAGFLAMMEQRLTTAPAAMAR